MLGRAKEVVVPPGTSGGIASPLCPLLKKIFKIKLKKKINKKKIIYKEKTFLLLFQKANSNHYKLSTKKLEKILTSVIIKARNK